MSKSLHREIAVRGQCNAARRTYSVWRHCVRARVQPTENGHDTDANERADSKYRDPIKSRPSRSPTAVHLSSNAPPHQAVRPPILAKPSRPCIGTPNQRLRWALSQGRDIAAAQVSQRGGGHGFRKGRFALVAWSTAADHSAAGAVLAPLGEAITR
jgi:hypothetical protein